MPIALYLESKHHVAPASSASPVQLSDEAELTGTDEVVLSIPEELVVSKQFEFFDLERMNQSQLSQGRKFLDSVGMEDFAHMFDSMEGGMLASLIASRGGRALAPAEPTSVFSADDFAAAMKLEEDEFNLMVMAPPVSCQSKLSFQPMSAYPSARPSRASVLESESEDMDEEEDEDEEYEPEAKQGHRHRKPPAARASASSLASNKTSTPATTSFRSKCSAPHSGFQMPAPVSRISRDQAAVNRAERIRRCREKKNNRTFEKTIRYETRKAYAEVRPRIKGRFVKGPELEAWKAAQAQAQAAAAQQQAKQEAFILA